MAGQDKGHIVYAWYKYFSWAHSNVDIVLEYPWALLSSQEFMSPQSTQQCHCAHLVSSAAAHAISLTNGQWNGEQLNSFSFET